MSKPRTLWQILKGTTDNWLEDQASSISAALLLWLYYSAQIFLFGAEFTACLGQSRTPKPLAAA